MNTSTAVSAALAEDRTFVDLSLSRTYSQINLKQSDLISITNYQLAISNYQLAITNHQLSTVNCQQWTVNSELFIQRFAGGHRFVGMNVQPGQINSTFVVNFSHFDNHFIVNS